MKLLFSFLSLLFFCLSSRGQTFRGDSLLANERSIDRPITVHARQVRVSGGYGLQLISHKFDSKGEIIRLKGTGLSSVRHRFSVDLKCGLNDYIQFNASIAQSTNIVREKQTYIFPIEPAPLVSQDVTTEYSGLEDVYVGLDLRAPLKTRKVDLALTLGISLPSAPVEPAQPEHSFRVVDEHGSTTNSFTYRYSNRLGKGIPIARLGGMAKFRRAHWALTTRFDYEYGLKQGTSSEWRHQLTQDGEFEYRRDPFSYRQPDSFFFLAEVEYQTSPTIDVFLDVASHIAMNGWTTPQDDMKLATPYQSIWSVCPGVEILVTPKVWLRERISFSLAGKNHEAPVGFETSLHYNFFFD